ncbi:MAG: hypothetical protein DMD28_02980 [Gemmatimonadetes bacterium]|nr:MAG: hypothetical protein DMD28_02980 [Gemmatimonadota bacterium]
MAVIVAAPAAIPVTRPVLLTVATAGALLAHVTVRPVSGLPLASFGVAVNSRVPPTATLGAAGLTVTVTTTLCNSPTSCWRSHAAATPRPTSSTFLSSAKRRDSLCLKVIGSL